MERFYGKYRGKVVNNIDPLQQGRIQVEVPSVLGEGRLSWAMPCVPYAGPGVGFFAIPPIQANVWVEFEGGNLDAPIWSGCFWGVGEAPAVPAIQEIKMWKTESVSLTLNDLPSAGGAVLEVHPPAVSLPLKITLNSTGIEINCNPASIKLTPAGIDCAAPPASVSIAPEKLELANTPSSLTLSPSGVETTNGPAAVKLAGPKIDLNHGALEVV